MRVRRPACSRRRVLDFSPVLIRVEAGRSAATSFRSGLRPKARAVCEDRENLQIFDADEMTGLPAHAVRRQLGTSPTRPQCLRRLRFHSFRRRRAPGRQHRTSRQLDGQLRAAVRSPTTDRDRPDPALLVATLPEAESRRRFSGREAQGAVPVQAAITEPRPGFLPGPEYVQVLHLTLIATCTKGPGSDRNTGSGAKFSSGATGPPHRCEVESASAQEPQIAQRLLGREPARPRASDSMITPKCER